MTDYKAEADRIVGLRNVAFKRDWDGNLTDLIADALESVDRAAEKRGRVAGLMEAAAFVDETGTPHPHMSQSERSVFVMLRRMLERRAEEVEKS